MNWTAERRQQLRDDWNATKNGEPELSTEQISKRLGTSRGAVCGMARRLGLPKRAETRSDLSRMGAKANRGRRWWLPSGERVATAPRKGKDRAPPAKKKTVQVLTDHATHVRRQTVAVVALPPEPVDDSQIPLARRKTLVELTSETCRWPVGDPCHDGDFFFCGGQTVANLPYCAQHCLVAYQPAKKVAA